MNWKASSVILVISTPLQLMTVAAVLHGMQNRMSMVMR